MGEIKPLGSEKLSGDDKLKRILELAYYQKPINENKTNKGSELIVDTKTSVFGIVKEKDGYYVKKGLNESSLDYIGGMFMKNKNRFHSYADAFKRLEFLKGQEQLNEATKYILKNKTTNTEGAAPAPTQELPAPAAIPEPTTPTPDGGAPVPDETSVVPDETAPEGEEDFGSDVQGDPLKTIQKLSGKLGQKLREYDDEIQSNDIKYVINMVLSAVDLEKLESDDKDEIVNKLEGEEDEYGLGDEGGMPSPDDEQGIPEPEVDDHEDELGEIYSSLEELTNTDLDFGDDEKELDEYYLDDEYFNDGKYFDDEDDDDFDRKYNSDNQVPEKSLGDILDELDEEDYIDNDIQFDEEEQYQDEDYIDNDIQFDEEEQYQDEDYGTVSKNKRSHSYSTFEDDLNDILGITGDDEQLDEYDDVLSLNEIKNLLRKKFKK
jgi:hypothetical protein